MRRSTRAAVKLVIGGRCPQCVDQGRHQSTWDGLSQEPFFQERVAQCALCERRVAVGMMRLGERILDGFGVLIEHWDGAKRSITPTPPLQPVALGTDHGQVVVWLGEHRWSCGPNRRERRPDDDKRCEPADGARDPGK